LRETPGVSDSSAGVVVGVCRSVLVVVGVVAVVVDFPVVVVCVCHGAAETAGDHHRSAAARAANVRLIRGGSTARK